MSTRLGALELGRAIRLLGIALMIAIAAAATYLEWEGSLDLALLPYFLAFTACCIVAMLAMAIEGERSRSSRQT